PPLTTRSPLSPYTTLFRSQTRIKELFSLLTDVFTAKNVRPTLRDEQLFPTQIELALVYDDYRSKSAGGFAEIGRQSQVGVVPTPDRKSTRLNSSHVKISYA